MKKTIKGYLLGFLSASLLVTGIGYAANTTTLYDVLVEGVKIVVDGQKINPTDANGNAVEPIIYNGTTYLPVRAVANALGKAVYWDGPNYTVYLGDMDGKLEYPTVMLKDMTSIGDTPRSASTDILTDNYDNRYQNSVTNMGTTEINFEYLLNMRYSRFKATLYIPKGTQWDNSGYLEIITDGHVVYTSPEMNKASQPIKIDVDITGCNDIEINFSGHAFGKNYNSSIPICLAEAGFYQ